MTNMCIEDKCAGENLHPGPLPRHGSSACTFYMDTGPTQPGMKGGFAMALAEARMAVHRAQ